MKILALAATALVAGLVAAPPAHAATGGFGVAGLSCGMVLRDSDRKDTLSGELTGGPLVAQRTDGPVSVSVTCSIHVGSPDPASPEIYSTTGAAGFVVAAVTVPVPNNASIYLCTEVVLYMPPRMPYHDTYDADPATPGAQCAPAKQGDGGVVRVATVPAEVLHVWCVRVDHGVPPYGYSEVCDPLG